MMARLKAQGADVGSISLYDGGDDNKNAGFSNRVNGWAGPGQTGQRLFGGKGDISGTATVKGRKNLAAASQIQFG